jgi:organic hydroperoxide reductase OsmC/OhrA
MRLEASFRRLEGTGAAVGRAGSKTVVADRRAGSAGGTGLGFSGGELQAFALGGGFFNQLHFSAAVLGLDIVALALDVALELDETSERLTAATIRVHVEVTSGQEDAERLLAHATRHSTVSNSVASGIPVTVEPA